MRNCPVCNKETITAGYCSMDCAETDFDRVEKERDLLAAENEQLKKPFTVDELRYALMILNHPMAPEGITLVGKLQVLMLEANNP